MNPTLSVIIPVYKVEKYLERCVKSVLDQGFKDLEVILVDDGSPDRCPQICDELANTDERISVIHKQNGGLSSARNEGIRRCKGSYITFLDSDDQRVAEELSHIMDNTIESGADMMMFESLSLCTDGSLKKRDYRGMGGEKYEVFSSELLYKGLIENGNLREQAGSHIIKTSLLKDNSCFFKEGILCEDTEFMFRVMRILDEIAITPRPLLLYTEQRPGSITNVVSQKRLDDQIEVIQCCIEYNQNHPNNKLKVYEIAHCSYQWAIALGLSSLFPRSQSKHFKEKLKRQIKFLNLPSHPKSKKVGLLYSILGLELTSVILGWRIKLSSKGFISNKKNVNG